MSNIKPELPIDKLKFDWDLLEYGIDEDGRSYIKVKGLDEKIYPGDVMSPIMLYDAIYRYIDTDGVEAFVEVLARVLKDWNAEQKKKKEEEKK